MYDTLIHDESRIFTAASGDKYRIEFHSDFDTLNPWEDWDGQTPMAYKRYGSVDLQVFDSGCGIMDPIAYMSDRFIAKHRRKIAEIIGGVAQSFLGYSVWTTPDEFDAYVAQEARDHCVSRDCFRREHLTEIADSLSLEMVAQLWELAGVPAHHAYSRGYCQGDEIEVLLVLHPDALRSWGFTGKRDFDVINAYRKACGGDFEKAFKADVNTLGAYVWGGVIGYKVFWLDSSDPDVAEALEAEDDINNIEGEEIDSCWGFFPEGTQHYFPLDTAHAYAIGQAQDAAEYDGKTCLETRAAAMAAQIEAARPDLAPTY